MPHDVPHSPTSFLYCPFWSRLFLRSLCSLFYLLSLVSVSHALVDKLQVYFRLVMLISPIVPNLDFQFRYRKYFVLTFVGQMYQCHRTLNKFRDYHCQKKDVQQVLTVEGQKLTSRVQRQHLSILVCP